MLLRSLLIMYSALPTSLELKGISVSSANINSATPELWHASDNVVYMDIKDPGPILEGLQTGDVKAQKSGLYIQQIEICL